MSVPSDQIDHRRNPDGNRCYDIKTLWDHHQEIIRLLSMGYRPSAIAAELGVHPQTVSNIRNNPIAQAKIRELQGFRDDDAASISKRIRDLAPVAINVLEDSLFHAEENIEDKDSRSHGIASARTVLEHAIPKKFEGRIIHGHVSLSQINKMKEEIERARVEKAIEVKAEVVE